MKKILFIILSSTSCDETFGLDNFLKGLSEDYDCHCLAPVLPVSYLYSHSSMKIKVLSSAFDEEEHQKHYVKTFENWETYYNELNPDAVFLVDTEFMITAEDTLTFKRKWLSIIKCPIATLEFNDRLEIEDSVINIKNASKYKIKTNPLKLQVTRVIASPPNKPILSLMSEKSPLYFFNKEPFSQVAMYSIKESLFEELRCPADSKVVMLFFSHQAMLEGLIGNINSLNRHYKAVIETVVHYLEQLDIPVQLLTFNMSKYEEIKSDKVNIQYFPLLSIEAYKHWLKASDLIMVESVEHPALIDAATLGIPGIVLANSVSAEEKDGKKYIVSEMEKITDKFMWDKMNELLNEAPEVLFGYVTFPNKTDRWTGKKFVSDEFFYYFVDLFNFYKTMPFIRDLLTSEDVLTKHKALLKEYINNFSDITLNSEDVLKQMLKE